MNDIDQGRIEHLRQYIKTLTMMQQHLLQEGDNEARRYYDKEIAKVNDQILSIQNQCHQ